jgi:hypothetical protein
MTDAEIIDIAKRTASAEPGRDGFILPVKFARALLAAEPQDSATGESVCSTHPDAPHGFNRDSSHTLGRYSCDCEGWLPDTAPSQPTVPVCRMLTLQETVNGLIDSINNKEKSVPSEILQRKFCEVNGLTLAAPTSKEPQL